jgi:dihydroorotate dehydrogenase
MSASGSLGFDGQGWPWEKPLVSLGIIRPQLFTSVTKTLTLHPQKGNFRWSRPWESLRLLPGGTLNAFALGNPGIMWWHNNIGSKVSRKKIPLVVSLFGEPDELEKMAIMIDNFDIVGVEINASCPNTKSDILENTEKIIKSVETVKKYSFHPLILKVSVTHDLEEIVKNVTGVVEAFSINSVPWNIAFPGRPSPLAHFGGGGVSGQSAQPHTWRLVKRLSDISSIPVIGPSVWKFEDMASIRHLGARAISFGSIFLRYPWRPNVFISEDF